MNYRKCHDALISRAPRLQYTGIRKRTWKNHDGTYREAHRVIPGCMGGTYICSNVVYLTPEEHYIIHQLLVKLNPGNSKLVYAVHMMTRGNKSHTPRNNKAYGWIKRKFAQTVGDTLRGRKRPEHSKKMKGWKKPPVSHESKQRMSISAKRRGINRIWTDVERKQQSEKFTGKGNPQYGNHKPKSAEHRAKIAAALKGNKNRIKNMG